jgi:phosphohistidine phosphatase
LKVYLIRHGEATDDGVRHLSERGRNDVLSLAKKLSSKNIEVAEIFHSGKERAKETCEILSKNLFSHLPIKISQDLMPNSDVSIWGSILNKGFDNYLLVGHLPFLPELTYYLTGEYIEFETSNIVCLEKLPSSKWKILWKIGP